MAKAALKKIAVAMSGGVDSSVAAALLKEKGYEVIGLTMQLGMPKAKGSCGNMQSIADARQVADILGIRHYVLDVRRQFRKHVVADFIAQYRSGLTPNPCVRCNERIKFDILLAKALELGAKYLATGHYARIGRSGNGFVLKKAKDLTKDQSYFLYRLTQDKLSQVLFPLGDLTKEHVRALAKRFRLPVAEKKESQEICFIPGSYQEFLSRQRKGTLRPGPIKDTRGSVIGTHKGIPFYTVGQRDKLGIARGYPVYVIALDAKHNTLVVGARDQACRSSFLVGDLVYPGLALKKKDDLKVRIRHLSAERGAQVVPDGKRARVMFHQPQFAITPGQSAVFYRGNTVVGGGIITRVLA